MDSIKPEHGVCGGGGAVRAQLPGFLVSSMGALVSVLRGKDQQRRRFGLLIRVDFCLPWEDLRMPCCSGMDEFNQQ